MGYVETFYCDEIFFGIHRNWVDRFSDDFVLHTCESVLTELDWKLHSEYCP